VRSLLRRWWWLLLAVPAAIGLWRVRIDVEMLNLLPPDQPAVQGLKLYQQYFANARELIITIRAAEAEEAERLAGALAARLRQETNLVVGVSWQPPWMEQPAQVAELVACLWLNQPPESFSALSNRLAAGHLKSVLAETKEALTTSLSPMDLARRAFDPYDLLIVPALTNVSGLSADQGQRMFASADGTFRVLFVQARPDLADYRSCSSWLTSVQRVVAGLRASQADTRDVVIRYTGRPAFVTEIAASMQRDLSGSIVGTAAIIALLFWLSHRRWLPMFWLLALLALILAATVGIGGLVLGSISVISLGFAAVLLGLAVDYAVVHYQEALAHPQMSVPEIRRAIAPSILWAAITTISAFLVLNLGGLPGLAQLGTLVAIGIALAALVMVVAFLPPLFPDRRKSSSARTKQEWWSYLIPPDERVAGSLVPANRSYNRAAFLVTALLVLVAGAVVSVRRPGLDKTTQALRPQHGEAEQALDEVTACLGISQDPIWVIASGSDEREVWQHLTQAEALLGQARSNQVISSYLLPTAMWPRAELQESNRATARWLGRQGPLLSETAIHEGFNSNALFLTEELVRTWARAGASTGVVWPTNQLSQWLLKRFMARTTNEWLVMGLVTPATNRVEKASLAELSSRLSENRVLLSGWELLGTTTLKRVQERLWLLVLPMVILVLASLWFAFRRSTEVLLGLAVLCLSGLCLLATMTLCGWSWNLLNLMALPLVLGTGVDYGIFVQLGLRRCGGDVRLVRRSIGRALLLCGGTAIAGFGSLAWSGNAGMASLGKVCAAGIGANVLISVYLLPAWWVRLSPKSKVLSPKSSSPVDGQPSSLTGQASHMTSPSSFYQLGLWRFGLAVVRTLPAWLVKACCVAAAEFHFRMQRSRREVVVQNLLPAVSGNRPLAEKTARRLYRNFGLKLADLWQVENGVPVRNWLTRNGEEEVIRTACGRGRGVLFITLHLGNWEHGGLLLADMGIKLTVLTLPEPEDGLTELRIASRARWGIETLIIGRDHFAFIEVIKKLQDGAALAISIDRPPERGSVLIELFGQPFRSSIAAAELARASGCALVGVTIVRQREGFAIRVLPEFGYDRRTLGSHEARRELTGQIMRAFEPEIREHLDQWYHFVPIWPVGPPSSP
jgi:predicted RND superfamily exporter protein/lauroyl/myristoyl acyltransferase